MQVITVVGMASGRVTELSYHEGDLNLDLLTWLRSKKITVASSCDGKGICNKCTIQNDWKTCELTLAEFLKLRPDGKIIISYL